MLFEDTCRDNLLLIATAFAKARGITLDHVGKVYYGKRSFFGLFRRGKRSLSVRKYDEMIHRFAAEWPAGASWPITSVILLPRPAKNNPGGKTSPPSVGSRANQTQTASCETNAPIKSTTTSRSSRSRSTARRARASSASARS